MMKEAMIVPTLAPTLWGRSFVNAPLALHYKKMDSLVMVKCSSLLHLLFI